MSETCRSEKLGANTHEPWRYPLPAWRAIALRCWNNIGRHNLSLMAAGVAFYCFLSFVPLLAALVMVYGLVADPSAVADHMRAMINLVPADAAKLIYDQLIAITTAAASQKGWGLAIALLVSIYGATRASTAFITALNVIYEESDRRGIVRGTIDAMLLIIGAVMISVLGILAASLLAAVEHLMAAIGETSAVIVEALTWTLAACLCCLTIGAMYRFAPDRRDARWQWVSLGAVVATLFWILATLGFSAYVANFAHYDATYGSLGAIVAFLMWLYVSAYVILVGALLNAELERQTAADTTTGRERPMGQRGATIADMSCAQPAR